MLCGTSPSFMMGYWVSSYRRIALSYWVNRTIGLQDSEDLVTWIDVSFALPDFVTSGLNIPVTTLT